MISSFKCHGAQELYETGNNRSLASISRVALRIFGLACDEYRAEMKRWYNGFRFTPDDKTTAYNPLSVALTLEAKQQDFRATWSSTGRPIWLIGLSFDPATRQLVDFAVEAY